MCFICERERWDTGDFFLRWLCCAMYSLHTRWGGGGEGVGGEKGPNTNLFDCTKVLLVVVVVGNILQLKNPYTYTLVQFVVFLQSRIVHFVVYRFSSSRVHSSSLTTVSLLLLIFSSLCVTRASQLQISYVSSSMYMVFSAFVRSVLLEGRWCLLLFLLARKNLTYKTNKPSNCWIRTSPVILLV